MTDERMGDALWPALARLPRGGGVIFRHYGLPIGERRALFAKVAQLARRRGLILVRAGKIGLGSSAQGLHGRDAKRHAGLKTWPAHGQSEIVAGRRAGADLFFISPVFASQSHPGGRSLGRTRATALARLVPGRAIALGGMNAARARLLDRSLFYGWAAIDAWLGDAVRSPP